MRPAGFFIAAIGLEPLQAQVLNFYEHREEDEWQIT
jgi:hypothetical protein